MNKEEKVNLDDILLPMHKELLQKDNASSQLVSHGDYELLFIRSALIDGFSLNYNTRRFYVTKEDIYEYDINSNVWSNLENMSSLFLEIDGISDIYEQILEGYSETIEEKEESLYLRKLSLSFLHDWFDLKRDLTRLDRILTRIGIVLKKFKKNTPEYDHLETIVEQMESNQRSASLLISRIDTIYNFVSSLKNDKMNRNLYVLTLISAIFLPLNFVIGFFGMNTPNMFLQNDPHGTLHVSFGMVLMVIVMLLGLPLFKAVERLVLRRILGRFSFYQKIAQKLDYSQKDI